MHLVSDRGFTATIIIGSHNRTQILGLVRFKLYVFIFFVCAVVDLLPNVRCAGVL